jgi:hypothetical protein
MSQLIEKKLENAIVFLNGEKKYSKVREAAAKFRVSPTTLARRIRDGKSRSQSHTIQQKLTEEQEIAFIKYLGHLVSLGWP